MYIYLYIYRYIELVARWTEAARHWVVCSTPDALCPSTLSPRALSPRALSTDGLSESVLYIVNSFEESPVSLIYDVRNTILDRFPPNKST